MKSYKSTLKSLAEFINSPEKVLGSNSSGEVVKSIVRTAIVVNKWQDTSHLSAFDICSDESGSRLVINPTTGKAEVI